MRILGGLVALLWLPSVAIATNVDLGDLDIPSSRVPQFYRADVAEATYEAAKQWPEYDATCTNAPCPSGRQGFRDAPGNPMSGCSAANPANNGGEDWGALNCMVDRAPDRSVIYIPNGTYDMGDSSFEMITISRNNVVLRGQSRTGTHLVATSADKINNPPNGVYGFANCGNNSASNCGSMIISAGRNFEGPARSWTGGYEEGAMSVTVANTSGMTVGGWIMLEMTCNALIPKPVAPSLVGDALTHIAKISAIAGNVVAIDRGLRMDYDDHGCSGSANARPYTPHSGIGIETMHLTTDPNLPQNHIGNGRTAFSMGGIVESWAVGNDIERWEDEVLRFKFSARNWVQGNSIRNFCFADGSFNTEGIYMGQGAVDNVVENNYGTDFCLFSKMDAGPEGNVFGYNYLRGGNPLRSVERAFMNHGMYTREMLFEGNDLDAHLLIADYWWGNNGPRNTAYRNRMVGTSKNAAIVTNHDGNGTWKIADQINILGNTAQYYYQGGASSVGFPNDLNDYFDLDKLTTNMWVEKNIYRDTSTCTGDPSQGRCGFHIDSPESTTMCGATPCSANGRDPGDNAGGNARPAAWSGDVVPNSLYREASAPSWWCQEACSWDDAHNGIGAWGDDFNRSLCKLPAQILAEGGVCTPIGGPAPPPPAALIPPILID